MQIKQQGHYQFTCDAVGEGLRRRRGGQGVVRNDTAASEMDSPSNTNPDIFLGAIVGLLMKVHQPKSKHHPLNDQYDAD